MRMYDIIKKRETDTNSAKKKSNSSSRAIRQAKFPIIRLPRCVWLSILTE